MPAKSPAHPKILRYFKPAPIRADGRHSPKPMSANKTVRPCSCPASDQAGKRTVSMALHVGDGSFATVWPVAGHFRSSPNIGRNQIFSLPATTLTVGHWQKSFAASRRPSGIACTHRRVGSRPTRSRDENELLRLHRTLKWPTRPPPASKSDLNVCGRRQAHSSRVPIRERLFTAGERRSFSWRHFGTALALHRSARRARPKTDQRRGTNGKLVSI
jgi:hypothetical protein